LITSAPFRSTSRTFARAAAGPSPSGSGIPGTAGERRPCTVTGSVIPFVGETMMQLT
jgi:hypothetical protein